MANERRARAIEASDEGIRLAGSGEREKARLKFQQAIDFDPAFGPAHGNLGNVYMDRGEPANALPCYDRALQLDPNHAQARYGRSVVRRQLGQHLEAAADLEVLLRDGGADRLGAREQVEEAFLRVGLFLRLMAPITEEPASGPMLPETAGLLQRGVARFRSGDAQESLRMLTKAIADDPRQAALFTQRAETHMNLGQYELAVADVRQALALDPKDGMAHGLKGTMLRYFDAPKEAVAEFDKAVSLGCIHEGVYFQRGLVRQGLGALQEAFDDFERTLGLNPDLAPAYYSRGLVRNVRGDLEGALKDYTLAIEKDPEYLRAYEARAITLNALGRPEEGKAAFAKFEEVSARLQS